MSRSPVYLLLLMSIDMSSESYMDDLCFLGLFFFFYAPLFIYSFTYLSVASTLRCNVFNARLKVLLSTLSSNKLRRTDIQS